MRNRDKILNTLHSLYQQIDHAEDMIDLYNADSTAAYYWEEALKDLEHQVAALRPALSKAGTFKPDMIYCDGEYA